MKIFGTDFAAVIANKLIGNGARFTCEPQPFDVWEFTVRDDRRAALRKAAAGAPIATDYLIAVAEHTVGMQQISPGLASSCEECQSDYDLAETDPAWEELGDEGRFSKWPCELCGSGMAGNRYTFHSQDSSSRETLHLSGCVDCLHYFANGTEPERWEA